MKEKRNLVALIEEFNHCSTEMQLADESRAEVLNGICAYLIDELISFGFTEDYFVEHQLIEL